METENKIKKAHTVQIATKITITGVTSVMSMEEKTVEVALDGKFLHLDGEDFNAEKLSVDEGVLILGGKLHSLKYNGQKSKQNLIKKLFK